MNVNEVEAAGNTPLHNAAYEGWTEGIELLISLGATVNASNNAGDRPWHWARNMGHTAAMAALEKVCSCLLGTGTRLAVINPLLMCSIIVSAGAQGSCLGFMCPHTKNDPVKQASGASAVHSNALSGCAARGEPGAGPGAGARPHPQSQGAGALPLAATKIRACTARAFTASARHGAHAVSCHADRVVLPGCCQSCTKVL